MSTAPGISAPNSSGPATTFYEAYPLKDLRPAEYNPRHLSEEAFERLQASITRHGVVKPVILNANGTLVAGHQRTKAMTALGMTHTPAVKLGQVVRLTDEIQFNLLHNRVETEASVVYAQPGPIGEWSWIPWQTIDVAVSRNKPFQQAISHMTGGHGAWGSVVIDDQGQIALNAEYAVVAAANHFDVLAWTCPSLDAAQLVADLTGEYGVYDWSGLEDQAPVYNQHIVQPKRLRQYTSLRRAGKLAYKSEVWEKLALPRLRERPQTRVVDFGAGHGDYAKKLRPEGYSIDDYEPYRTTPGKYAVDIKGVVSMIRTIEKRLAEHGLYEMVVLDSVINATTSLDYQHWVLTAVNALCAGDGTVCIGTRNLLVEQAFEAKQHTTSANDSTRLSFLDAENVDMRFMQGKWMRIRYHTPGSLTELLEAYFGQVTVAGRSNATLRAVCKDPLPLSDLDYEKALDEEFNMPYPNDFRHGRHKQLTEILIKLVKERNSRAD
ncbi:MULTISPECIES: ParB N-terminal domain-containing protein [unclassified Streptomyces]|uniref:ParB N-terminal domain-containing protein n=1 Tax=unclassified Streptomyces TaxID=2593676 RepID=UPI002E7FD81D|nr:ParB N-terminal domain-containing protein [Streptomyces sp. NBC_00589]WTI37490.1 ParB N-terminal domain-containing protein [Streptomyces sp. NBC_00775]WUB28832.1 ParB N-terminal domain-containing protein [Streptomyces sp. NBC_00589]